MSHAELSPSSAHRWMACPGSVALCRGIPDTSSHAAREGTAAHELGEMCLKSHQGAAHWIGYSLHVEEETFDVDAEMAEHVQTYVDVVRILQKGLAPSQLPNRDDYVNLGKLHVEQKVHAVRDVVYGTADATVVTPDVLHVVDFKYGAGVHVEVEENVQAMCYALGSVNSTPDWGGDTIKLHIVQPRHRLGGHSSWSISWGDLKDWGCAILLPAVERTKQPDAPLVPGEKQCQFCPAKATCPALEEAALDAAREAFGQFNEDEHALDPIMPVVAEVSPERLAQILTAIPMAEKWFKAVKAHAAEQALAGVAIPGHKTVKVVGNRTWKDAADAEAMLSLFVAEANLKTEPKLISPAQVEKLLSKADWDLVASHTTKPDKGTALVPESDKRPAHNAADIFKTELTKLTNE